MLHAIAELTEDRLRNVERILRHEIHADALRTDQPDHLLDLLHQHFGRIVKQQVRFVEEQHHYGLRRVADLRQLLVKLGQQPQQKTRVQLRRVQQLIRGEHVDDALSVAGGLNQIVDVEHRLAEELVGALFVESGQSPLDRAD